MSFRLVFLKSKKDYIYIILDVIWVKCFSFYNLILRLHIAVSKLSTKFQHNVSVKEFIFHFFVFL